MVLGVTGALAWTLLPTAELLIPILRVYPGEHWAPLRLFNLVHYAEDPHNIALSLLPLALLFLRRSMMNLTWLNAIAAIAMSSLVVLANSFGAIDLAIGCVAIALAVRKGMGTLVLIGLAAWLWISPWLPPSPHSPDRGGSMDRTGLFSWRILGISRDRGCNSSACVHRAPVGIAHRAICPGFRRRHVRDSLGFFLCDITLVPQANRYQLELELAVSLIVGHLCARIPRHFGLLGGAVLVAAVGVTGVFYQAKITRFSRQLLAPLDITQTTEYRTTMWLDRNLPGQRAMVSGDAEIPLQRLFG